jgi:DNA invertase Pin-like site-specific DNA recombinase
MGKLLGYARVIFEEKASDTKRDNHTELAKLLAILGDGDTLVVTRLDRLGRSLRDLADLAQAIETAGANLKVLEQHVDTTTGAGRAFFGVLAVLAAFEIDVRRERQAEGIAQAKRAGVYKGGVKRIDRARVWALKESGSRPSAIAVAMGISRRQVYRILEEQE